MLTILKQLIKIYKELHKDAMALSKEELEIYYTKMLKDNRIEYILENREVVGFMESWRLDYEQLGRVVCWKDFNAMKENIKDGKIVYICDVWVKKTKRDGIIFNILLKNFENSNKDGHSCLSRRHGGKYIRVYNKENALKLNKGDYNGRR